MTSLDAIRARLEAATPRPWHCDGFADGEYVNLGIWEGDQNGREIVAGITRYGDAELFMAAPMDIARLLATVEAATTALAKHGNPDPAEPQFGEFDAGYRAGRRALRAIVEQAIDAALKGNAE